MRTASTWQVLRYEPWVGFSVLLLLALGVVMLASASMNLGESLHQSPFYYSIRQIVYFGVGAVGLFIFLQTPVSFWQKKSGALFMGGLLLLACVLIPGIGKEVNGSLRWLNLFGLNIQVSEFMKLAMVIYLAAYVAEHKNRGGKSLPITQPLFLVGLVMLLLLGEPDFGAVVVVAITALSILFLAGVRLRVFLLLFVAVALALSLLAFASPYRMERLTSFLDPWRDAFSEGYQLTQSLIAFGRGEWFGLGLGNGVQKLFYLPEAHTDFLLAVLAEEFGLVGVLLVIVLFCMVVARGCRLSLLAVREEEWFHAYLAFGLSLLLAIEVLVNMGVNMGILPTKGLTLPLMSYGGSSLVANSLLLGLLFRISFEIGGRDKGEWLGIGVLSSSSRGLTAGPS
ncbi:MAG: putative lipid II flippase FtsW [Gammaproteobacteria bacterium]|nr:putative lipid II flippase FtsW [Gammaproteobacteria bacterium]